MSIPRVRTSVVCVHQNKLLGFHAEDPATKQKYIFLPGGKVEPEESAPEGAERETLEETGYSVQVLPLQSVDREYLFRWNNEDYDCLTIFYVGKLTSPFAAPVSDAEYHRGVVWIPVEEIPQHFSYSPDILSAIQELIFLDQKA